ncbi:halocin C8-like domain-containing protein [Halorussus salinus]|uniref:halocin C8-like domain-containing protein n=1 Tax=Halorussus salinus TaxID=1364935 RepID=UPI0010931233|nr:halocin C8-like domain-containing protein [Halorussus salinus]
MKDTNSNTVSRRNVLRSLGVAGAATATATGVGPSDLQVFGDARAQKSAADRTLVVEASGEVTYEFSVTGLLSAVDAPARGVKLGTAKASLEGGRHEFSFTGEFTEFEVDGDANVTVDGRPFDYESFPHETLEIVADGSVSYDVSASGALEVSEGTATRRDDRRVEGTLSGGSHVLSYAGELTYLDLDGDATLVHNGTEVASDTPLPLTDLGEATVEARGESYELTFGHDAAVSGDGTATASGRAVVESQAKGGTSTVRYIGGFVSLDVPGVGSVRSPPGSQRLELEATGDTAAEFTVRTTGQFANGERAREVTVEGGEIDLVSVTGRPTEIVVSSSKGNRSVTVSLDYGADEERVDSSVALQLAAEMERREKVQTLLGAASEYGRVRHDAGGITAVSPPEGSEYIDRETVVFDLTDLQRGDGAQVLATASADATNGYASYEWKTSDGFTKQQEFDSFDGQSVGTQSADNTVFESNAFIESYGVEENGVSVASTGATLATTSVTFNVDAFRTAHQQAGDQVRTQGLWNDFWGAVQDAINWCTNAFSSVDTKDLEEIGGDLAITSHTVKFDLAEELSDEGDLPRGFKGATFLWTSAITFAQTDAAKQLLDHGYIDSCSGCAAAVQLGWDIGCSYASPYICGAAGIASGGVGLVACATFVSLLCNLPNTEENADWVCNEAGAC